MSVVPTGLTRTVAVGALTALVVAIGGPSYAGDGDKPNVGVTQTGSNTAGVQASQTTTQVTPGQSGSSGTGYTGSSSSSSTTGSDPASAFPGVTDPARQGACNPALYGADGYSYNLALPAPCIQPEQTDEPEGEQPPAPPQVTTEMVTAAARVVAPTEPATCRAGDGLLREHPEQLLDRLADGAGLGDGARSGDPACLDADQHDVGLR